MMKFVLDEGVALFQGLISAIGTQRSGLVLATFGLSIGSSACVGYIETTSR